jgi:hypothetical protein
MHRDQWRMLRALFVVAKSPSGRPATSAWDVVDACPNSLTARHRVQDYSPSWALGRGISTGIRSKLLHLHCIYRSDSMR